MLRILNSGDFAQGTENWKQMRSCFVTASYAAEVVRIRKDRKIRYAQQKQAEWSLDGQTYLGDQFLEEPSYGAQIMRKSMEYGSVHEKRALENYTRALTETYQSAYQDVRVATAEVAFYVNKECTLLASPDGEVSISYTRPDGVPGAEFGLVEIKCPVGAFFREHREARTDRDITFQKYPGLLLSDKNANIPAPKFSLRTLKDKESIRRKARDTTGPHAFTIYNESPYKKWYIQCLCNLYTAPNSPLFIDLCIWTAPSAPYAQGTHTWWFKERDGAPKEPHPNLYVERFYRDDPLVLEDWSAVNRNIQAFYIEHSDMFYRNIMNCLRQWNAETQVSPDSAVEPPCDPSEAAASSQT